MGADFLFLDCVSASLPFTVSFVFPIAFAGFEGVAVAVFGVAIFLLRFFVLTGVEVAISGAPIPKLRRVERRLEGATSSAGCADFLLGGMVVNSGMDL